MDGGTNGWMDGSIDLLIARLIIDSLVDLLRERFLPPDSWEDSAGGDSSDSDDGAEAVAPVVVESLTSPTGDEDDDDNVLVLTEAEEEQLAAEVVVDNASVGLVEEASPVDPPTE
eukprot:scaffold344786_cov31-Prasinocladus_malaysianus.AAC.1